MLPLLRMPLLVLGIACLCGAAQAGEAVTIEIPGGKIRGEVVKLDEKELVMQTAKGKQSIPVSFLDAKALFIARRGLADLTSAKARFELGKFALDKGMPALAEKEFEEVAKLDMAVYKADCVPLLPKLKEAPAAPPSGGGNATVTSSAPARAPNSAASATLAAMVPTIPVEKPPTEAEIKQYWTQADFAVLNPIDQFVLDRLKSENLPPSPRCTDDEFVRRVYLDVLGVIPSAEDVQVFLSDPSSDKRAKLVDKVLGHERYAAHWSALWGDLLREHSEAPQEEGTYPASYRRWIHDALAKNMPYDQFVAELVTATGRADFNGAANFFLRDGRDRTETINTVSAVFMGTRMQCAQCHDHPFDTWEQADFHGLMAFFAARTQVVRDDLASVIRLKEGLNDDYYKDVAAKVKPFIDEAEKKIVELKKAEEEARKKAAAAKVPAKPAPAKDAPAKNAPAALPRNPNALAYNQGPLSGGDLVKRMFDEVEKALGKDKSERLGQMLGRYRANWVYEKDGGEYHMPQDIGGGRSGAVFPWDKSKKYEGSGSQREALARFLIADRQFAVVQANRLWSHLFGRGVVHPVDDFRRKNPPAVDGVLDFLADEFVKAKFDNKAVLRIILNSNTYQRSSLPNKANKKDETFFSHRVLRRMTAEQIYDSVLVASGQKGAPRVLQAPAGMKVAEIPPRGQGGWAYEQRTPAYAGSFMQTFNQPDREQMTVERDNEVSISQALELFNGGSINEAARADKGGAVLEHLSSGKFNGNDIVNLLYLRTLSRFPTPQELGVARGYVGGGAKPQVEDLLWSLMNTREFMFVK
ncbi:MAG: hypothetical protein AMXMBFR7_22200 [Planctomycetota bacterium]